ncbi:type VI secretion system tip protein TssI/VgrG [Variovorax defluvii]|uniref:Type VI secretion system tip protein TssI/VgrG n=1 Tax=Variovorax defluvii TaxID=913761 RepID=A0ABP8IAC1_9BURK
MAEAQFQIKSESPVAADLMFWSVAGHEGLSRASFYELTVLSKNHAITAEDILGHAFDVVIAFKDAQGSLHERHCHGHATRLMRLAAAGRYFEYQIQLRSWFWLLTKRTNSRILQDKPVLDVMDEVLEDSPIKRLKKTRTDHVLGVHASHPYCVQYQESDHAFISRLLEDEGIYYWFDAHDRPGTMHLSDALDLAHEKLPVVGTLDHAPDGSEPRFSEIAQWVSMRQFDTGKYASRDNDFRAVSKKLSADKGDPDAHELSDLESFEFPGGYADGDDAENIAGVRLDELVGRRQRHWAFTRWPDVAVGKRFDFKGDPDGLRDGEYVIAACTFVVTHPGYESIDPIRHGRSLAEVLKTVLDDDAVNADSRSAFETLIVESPALRTGLHGSGAFLLTLLPTDMPWRPPRLTPRARMPGPQCALVVGKSGEEIWTDEFGRVKVQFHWDRYGKKDENSSCWMRVSQPWAGKGWGAVAIPRIGQEVIVDFLDGDPDQPIIVGRFYNGESMPPYALPANAVVSGLKTSTHKGNGYNEMSMNDTAGKEMITIHGQYDMSTTVLHDQSTTVNNNRTDRIDVDDSETVGNNQRQSIGVNQSISVGTNRDESVGGTETITIGGHRTETVNGGETVTVTGGRVHTVNGVQTTTISLAESHSVGAGRMHNVGAGEMIDVGGAQMVNIGGAQVVNVGSLQKVSVGGLQSFSVGGTHKLAAAVIGETSKGPIKIKAGAVCMIEAPTIVLKAGGSKIVLDSSGITIKGAKITIKADGSASFKAGGSIKIKGANLGED